MAAESDDKGKEKTMGEDSLSEGDSLYQEGDKDYMEEFDEDMMDDDGCEDGDAMSFDDDELDFEDEGLVEEHPFESDAPPQAALLDFSAPQESPYVNLEPLSFKDVLPPGTKRKARPNFGSQ